MGKEANELLKFAQLSEPLISKQLALIISKSSKDVYTKEIAKKIYNEEISIDILELESLVNPNKFNFSENNLDETIGLEV